MLWFERQVVRSLMDPSLDEDARTIVETYVDQTLRSMPEHLRAGVAAESLLFGAWPRLRHALGSSRQDDAAARGVRARVDRWTRSGFDPLRQYVRLLHSLVLFAEHELVADAA
jgi:hypothetical protein